jgi:YVTN family beta-propeller protein
MSRTLALMLVLAVAAAGVAAAGSSGAPEIRRASRRSTVAIPTGKHPSGVVVAAGSLWVTNDVDNTVSQIDLATNAVARTIALHGRAYPDPAYATFDGSAVWVVARTTGTVSRIDARSGQVTATTEVPGLALGIAVVDGAVWVPSFDPYRCSGNKCFSRLTRLDAQTAGVTGRYEVDTPTGISFGYGSLWIVDHRSARVTRFDPRRARAVATISDRLAGEGTFEGPEQVVAGLGGVWVSHPGQGVVSRIAPVGNKVVARVKFPRNSQPLNLAIGAGSVWAVGAKRIFRIDPATNRIVASAAVGKHPGSDFRGLRSVAVTAAGVWVTDGDADTVDLVKFSQ